jgi:hypothetical protein
LGHDGQSALLYLIGFVGLFVVASAYQDRSITEALAQAKHGGAPKIARSTQVLGASSSSSDTLHEARVVADVSDALPDCDLAQGIGHAFDFVLGPFCP